MVYSAPDTTDPLVQGDIIDDCPVVEVASFDPDAAASVRVRRTLARVVVMTQSCDLAVQKTSRAVIAPVYAVEKVVGENLLKASDIRGPVRAGRVYGWYFLPSESAVNLPESIIDLRLLHTIPVAVLSQLCLHGKRRARIQSPYREHLAKHRRYVQPHWAAGTVRDRAVVRHD
jgi:hypothetical protein